MNLRLIKASADYKNQISEEHKPMFVYLKGNKIVGYYKGTYNFNIQRISQTGYPHIYFNKRMCKNHIHLFSNH